MYLFTEKTTAVNQRVLTQVFDESVLNEQEKAEGYQIDELPAYNPQVGRMGNLYRNKVTGEVFYVYETIVLPPDSIERRMADVEMAIAAILGGVV